MICVRKLYCFRFLWPYSSALLKGPRSENINMYAAPTSSTCNCWNTFYMKQQLTFPSCLKSHRFDILFTVVGDILPRFPPYYPSFLSALPHTPPYLSHACLPLHTPPPPTPTTTTFGKICPPTFTVSTKVIPLKGTTKKKQLSLLFTQQPDVTCNQWQLHHHGGFLITVSEVGGS